MDRDTVTMLKQKLLMGLGWLAATAVGVVLASQAVALVRDDAGPPTLRLAADTIPVTTATTTTTPPSTTVPPAATTTVPPSSTTTSTAAPAGSSTTVPAQTSTTTTTAPTTTTTAAPPSSTTTSTTAPQPSDESTFTLQGGIAVVACLGDEPVLLAAVPAAGFSVETEFESELEIEFESESHESKLRVECSAGSIDVRIEERSK